MLSFLCTCHCLIISTLLALCSASNVSMDSESFIDVMLNINQDLQPGPPVLQKIGSSYSFVHQINEPDEIEQFFNAPNGHRIKSKLFTFDVFQFQLQIYPNGHTEHQSNTLIVYLCAPSLVPESDLSAVLLDWTLYIHELELSQIAKGRHHSDVTNCRGIVVPDFESRIHSKNQSALTFDVDIQIKSLYNASVIDSGLVSVSLDREYAFNWIIESESMLQQLELAQHQQTFCGPLHDELWYLTLSPNGFHEKGPGSFDIVLNLVVLPGDLRSIKMQCVYRVDELGIAHSLNATWTHTDKGWGWSSGQYATTLLTQNLDFFDTLNISVQCETLQIVDLNGSVVMDGEDWSTIMLTSASLWRFTGDDDFMAELMEMDIEELTATLEQHLNAMLEEFPEFVQGDLVQSETAGIIHRQFVLWQVILYFNIAVVTTALASGIIMWQCQ